MKEPEMITQKQLNETLEAHIPPVAWDATVAIVIEINRTLRQFGTGTLLKIADQLFVVTAAHVIRQAKKLDGSLCLAGKKGAYAPEDWAEITNITVSDDQFAPARFSYKTATGVGTVDISLCAPMTHAFNTYFSETDPETERKSQELAAEKELKKQMKVLRDKYNKYKWSKKVWNSIENGKVFIGMTKLQATLTWGEPESVNRTIGSWGEHEQWVYTHKSYLYFENGILKAIQN